MSQKQKTHIVKTEIVANNTMSITFERPADFNYRPGQTIDLGITNHEGHVLHHSFSLVSAPHEDCLTITTRIRESEYKNILKKLQPKSEVIIGGPFGSFFLHQDDIKPAVFLVGGIGITPFISMIKDVIENTLRRKLYLFYSNRMLEDTAFFQELAYLSTAHPDILTFVPTMTGEIESRAEWSGEKGYIDWEVITDNVSNLENAVFYTAGPATMVKAMRDLLTEHKISEDSIRTEEFAGY